MIVWISGPTGSGKSSLARALATLGYVIVQEVLPKELFRAFSVEPSLHCARLQEAIIRSRFAQWRSARTAHRVIFDRSIDEDVHVFCRMHQELGFLNYDQLQRLHALASELQQPMPIPDLIIFLQPNHDVIVERLKSEAHPNIIITNIARQVELYAEWISTRRENILRLDNSTCSLQALQNLFGGVGAC